MRWALLGGRFSAGAGRYAGLGVGLGALPRCWSRCRSRIGALSRMRVQAGGGWPGGAGVVLLNREAGQELLLFYLRSNRNSAINGGFIGVH